MPVQLIGLLELGKAFTNIVRDERGEHWCNGWMTCALQITLCMPLIINTEDGLQLAPEYYVPASGSLRTGMFSSKYRTYRHPPQSATDESAHRPNRTRPQ